MMNHFPLRLGLFVCLIAVIIATKIEIETKLIALAGDVFECQIKPEIFHETAK